MNLNLKMLKNDLKRNPAGNTALFLFIALASGLVCAAVITLTQLFTSISGLYETASFNFINKYYVWRHCKYQFLFIITNPFHLGDSHA